MKSIDFFEKIEEYKNDLEKYSDGIKEQFSNTIEYYNSFLENFQKDYMQKSFTEATTIMSNYFFKEKIEDFHAKIAMGDPIENEYKTIVKELEMFVIDLFSACSKIYRNNIIIDDKVENIVVIDQTELDNLDVKYGSTNDVLKISYNNDSSKNNLNIYLALQKYLKEFKEFNNQSLASLSNNCDSLIRNVKTSIGEYKDKLQNLKNQDEEEGKIRAANSGEDINQSLAKIIIKKHYDKYKDDPSFVIYISQFIEGIFNNGDNINSVSDLEIEEEVPEAANKYFFNFKDYILQVLNNSYLKNQLTDNNGINFYNFLKIEGAFSKSLKEIVEINRELTIENKIFDQQVSALLDNIYGE